MRQRQLPAYCRQKSKSADRAFVEIEGHRHYLGPYDSPESHELYHRTIAQWLTGTLASPKDPCQLTVVELALAFWRHAQTFYRRPDGTPTSSIDNYRMALRSLKQLYGSSFVTEVTPQALKVIRQQMIHKKLARTTINQQVNLIRRVFKWGVAEGLVPVQVHTALLALDGLRQGRSDAKENGPVKPVPENLIQAVQPYVSRQVWALVQLQLLTTEPPSSRSEAGGAKDVPFKSHYADPQASTTEGATPPSPAIPTTGACTNDTQRE